MSENPPSAPGSTSGPPRLARRAWIPALLAGAIVLGLWGPNLLRPPPPAWTVYTSIKGQTRKLKLADKTMLWMNGATTIRVVFTDSDRTAAFDSGEAEFLVRSTGRPLLLQVGDREIRTPGADFDLRRFGRAGAVTTVLTLRRGQAAAARKDGGDARALQPGDEISWTDGQPTASVRRIDAWTAFAWQDRKIVFDHTPLMDVTVSLNRYLDRPITIAQPSVGNLQFTGELPIDREDLIIKRLEKALPVQAQPLRSAIMLKARGS